MTTLSIRPLSASIDEPIAIGVADLAPGSRVRLRLRNHSLKAEARAEFVASAEGTVDVALQAPVAGDYEGTRNINGLERKSIFREYADSVTDGLVEYYSKARK